MNHLSLVWNVSIRIHKLLQPFGKKTEEEIILFMSPENIMRG